MTTDFHLPAPEPHRYQEKKKRYRIAAVIIFILGVGFSLAIWQFTRQAVQTAEKSRFEHYTEMIRTLITERVDEHVAALRGLRAFVDSSEEITKDEWQTYIDDLDITHHFKGCIGFSYIRHVPRQELQLFLAEEKSETPDFSVTSSGNSANMFIVETIQPLERNRTIVGYDLAQDENLRKVLLDSVRSGNTVLSDATGLVSDGDNQHGVLLLLPVYKEPLRAGISEPNLQNLRGWVGASILVGEMITGIESYFSSPLDIEVLNVKEGGKPDVLYDADGELHSLTLGSQNKFSAYEMFDREMIKIADRTWALDIYALPGFSEKVAHRMPEALLLAGLMLSLFSALQVALYGKTLERAQELAKEMTRELRLSEQRFHKMFQEHNAVMLLVDPETGKIVDANEAACQYYGYPREQIISLTINKINIQSAHETRDAMQQIRERQKNHFEFKHVLSNGELRNVEIYSSPIIIEGKVLLFSVIHDISERKRAESELAQYRENLESLVDEQTGKLKEAHAKLLQRERLTTLGKLTATVSHELRNPLGTIKTALFSIGDSLDQQDPQRATRPLELAERSIDRCVTIIEELNSYARAKRLETTETDLDNWLSEVMAEQSFPEGIRCELNLVSGARVPFDREKLRQVIVNLVSNAIHALQDKDADNKLLEISSQLLEDQCEISVKDNGSGMSEETREKIFEPLYSTKGFGVGLGMVVVKNIVEQHRGRIIIESEQNVGTIISILLPLALPQKKRLKNLDL